MEANICRNEQNILKVQECEIFHPRTLPTKCYTSKISKSSLRKYVLQEDCYYSSKRSEILSCKSPSRRKKKKQEPCQTTSKSPALSLGHLRLFNSSPEPIELKEKHPKFQHCQPIYNPS